MLKSVSSRRVPALLEYFWMPSDLMEQTMRSRKKIGQIMPTVQEILATKPIRHPPLLSFTYFQLKTHGRSVCPPHKLLFLLSMLVHRGRMRSSLGLQSTVILGSIVQTRPGHKLANQVVIGSWPPLGATKVRTTTERRQTLLSQSWLTKKWRA